MNNYEILQNVDLKKYNTYGIGKTANWLVKPRSINALKDLIKYLKEHNIPFYLLGGGSNVILPDKDYKGVIIKLDLINDFSIIDNVVYAGAGLSLNAFIKKLLDLGYTNFAPLFGIPGSLGGAIIGNAGSFENEIFDDLISIKIMNYNGTINTVNKENIKYEYRNTEYKKNKDIIILGATFKIVKGNIEEANKLIKINLQKRKETQPLEYKNAGSVFKNPEGVAAGYLIEHVAGLKGYRINDACISDKHANFIINLGNAKSSDIIKLINLIKRKIKDKKNIELELEQVIVKW